MYILDCSLIKYLNTIGAESAVWKKIIPKLTFGSPLEDLSPPLSRQEFTENMIIKSVKKVNKLTESN